MLVSGRTLAQRQESESLCAEEVPYLASPGATPRPLAKSAFAVIAGIERVSVQQQRLSNPCESAAAATSLSR